jgi:uncharacterized Fe-S cluster-containing radical SAM superfamily protein
VFIASESLGIHLRGKCLDVDNRAVRLARLSSGAQTSDKYHEFNCDGFGRLRRFEHFKLFLGSDDAKRQKGLFRNLPPKVPFFAQSFQLGACDLRCWYCFVDNARLSAHSASSEFVACAKIFNLYRNESNRPNILDLSGGQPDIVPEWTVWMLEEIERSGLRGQIHVWIDDNLANDFFWRFLSEKETAFVCSFPRLSRVGCFKGYSPRSFAFNTGAHADGFTRQFELFKRFLNRGSEMYAYATFTSEPDEDLRGTIARFADALQSVHERLPLRVVPLKIYPFTATKARMTQAHCAAIEYQHVVYEAWLQILEDRFTRSDLEKDYDSIRLN